MEEKSFSPSCGKNVFITVGTTEFSKLISSITTKKVIDALLYSGYEFIQLQTGSSFTNIEIDPALDLTYEITREGDSTFLNLGNKITLKYDSYFENFSQEISKSDLVISHAGAGTCLEVLRHKKPLIVIVNEDLMDNHQQELAEEMQSNGYLYYGNCDNLHEVLKKSLRQLKKYPQMNGLVFPQYLDKCIGYST
ncbi:hypothetical protein JTB14_012310 [Gonioctena quinquepunctata]|nr:hypothetical protein JTB14_012310 [Gonioctena quinquepunctata]